MRTSHFVIVLCAFGWLGLVDPSSPAAQSAAPNVSPAVALVKVDLIVIDENERSVHDIRPQDLELVVDDVPQKISYFAKVEKPVYYSLVIDTSQSFHRLLVSALAATKLLIGKNRPSDETTLIRFSSSDNIETVVPFTSDKSALLSVPLEDFYPLPGQSAVLDAIYLSAETVAKHKIGDTKVRRAVVLISDGEDRASYYSRSRITKQLNDQSVQLFIIGMTGALSERSLMKPNARDKAERLLGRIAKDTGGRLFLPSTRLELLDSVEQIVQDLHSQYVIGFDRNIQPGQKGYQKFKLAIAPTSPRPKLKTITKPGFWLTPPETKDKK